MKKMLVEEVIVKTLEANGVQNAFGFPGETTLPLYKALKESSIKHYLARDERCAAHMADGYARITNKIGVCDAPAGMGVPFLCPALLEAYNSSTPMLAIVSDTPKELKGKWATSELDQETMLKPVTKQQYVVSIPNNAAALTAKAIKESISGRSRPTLLQISYNLFGQTSKYSTLKLLQKKGKTISSNLAIKAIAMLLNAQKPLILAGGGVFLSGAENELIRFAEQTMVPVATTLTGKGAIPEIHPLSLGVVGGKGRDYSNEYAMQADCVLILGSKLGEKSTNSWTFFKKTKLIRVDIDKKELNNNYNAEIKFNSTVKLALQTFLKCLTLNIKHQKNKFLNQKKSWSTNFDKQCEYNSSVVKPQFIIKKLQELSPKNTILVADGSTASGWTGVHWICTDIGRKFIASRGTGMIGFSLPASIGAKIGASHDKVISISGDGGFMFSCHELETAHRYNIPIVQIILNNQSLRLLQQHGKYFLGDEIISNYDNVDFVKLSESCKVTALEITRKSQVQNALKTALAAEEPIVLDFKIDRNELSPDFVNTLKRKKIVA